MDMPKLRVGCPLQRNLPSQGWDSIEVFDQRRIIWSLGIGGFLGLCVALAWYEFDAASLPLGSPSLIEFVLVVTVLVIGHEGLHLLGFPHAGLDSNTLIGIWPQLGSPYVQYLSPMARNQFLLSVLLPFLILTILPFILVAGGIGSVGYLSWISVLNSVGAGSDLFIFVKMLSVVPVNASVMENGDRMYWTNTK
jgi:hypothetical protein